MSGLEREVMTKEKVIKALELNIKTAKTLLKSEIKTDETKFKIQGLIRGYKFCIKLLKSK